MRTFFVSYNFIVVTFIFCPLVHSLILDTNLLKQWYPNYKTNATTISLSYSNIDSIAVTTFDGLTNLLKLDLSSNRLKTLDPLVFKSLANLQELDLSSNQILSKEQSLSVI